MKVKNRLLEILQDDLGIKAMVPTHQALTEKLGGMTVHRFNKLLNNAGPKDIQPHEVHLLTSWLSSITGKPKNSFKLIAEEEAASC